MCCSWKVGLAKTHRVELPFDRALINYRIAMLPQQRQKVFTLQTLPA
jgi:hypothetical protein